MMTVVADRVSGGQAPTVERERLSLRLIAARDTVVRRESHIGRSSFYSYLRFDRPFRTEYGPNLLFTV